MMIDRYFDQLFHSTPRIPSRLVRYGIIHTDTLKNALDGFEPRFDPAMKAQAEKMVEKLQAFIQLMEEYEENTTDGPTEEDEAKASK
jgi:hypothetical protein